MEQNAVKKYVYILEKKLTYYTANDIKENKG